MADTARPGTPGRKLFKASSMTKTPPVRKARSVKSASSVRSSASPEPSPRTFHSSPSFADKLRGATPRFVRKVSSSHIITKSPKPALDEIVESTPLEPLTTKLDVEEGRIPKYAASDSMGDAPIGLIDNDALTPTDTRSRTPNAGRALSTETSDTMTGPGGAAIPGHDSTATGTLNEKSETAGDSSSKNDSRLSKKRDGSGPRQPSENVDSVKNNVSKSSGPTTEEATSSAQNESKSAHSPDEQSDIAKFFLDKGHSEFSEFIKALTAAQDIAADDDNTPSAAQEPDDNTSEKASKPARELTSLAPNLIDELPTDDDLVMGSKDNVGAETKNSQPESKDGQRTADETSKDTKNDGDTNTQNVTPDGTGKPVGTSSPFKTSGSEEHAGEDASKSQVDADDGDERTIEPPDEPNNASRPGSRPQIAQLPDPSSITRKSSASSTANQKPSSLQDATSTAWSLPDRSSTLQSGETLTNGSAKGPKNGTSNGVNRESQQQSDTSNTTDQAQKSAKGVQTHVDNMGRPARINRQINIPLPRPEKPTRSRSRMQMPEVDSLPGTDNLNDVNNLEDPPEEFLDPSVHSPQSPAAVIDQIPPVSKVTPITDQPPPDLARLANGLGGNKVDDVGNIVDDSGKVLGHATGDLPAMIGKKVADNGEVYGDNGELIGFVTENFTGHPPQQETPQESPKPLPGGLRIDIDGNILDSSGAVVGKMNSKPGQASDTVTHFQGNARDGFGQGNKPEAEEQQEKKENSGIPADIFLDVKSTPDGIQLTIRIPTIFKQETRQTTDQGAS